MRKKLLTGTASAMALLLSACGTSEEPAPNAVTGDGSNMAVADASSPFAASDMKMHGRMMAAVGTDVGDSWVRKMIEHHQGALDMSEIAIKQNVNADAAGMARMTITKQGKEIENLRNLVKQGSPNPQSGELYRASTDRMHDAMMAAKGADITETFLRKMLEHHRGGVTMSDVALKNGVSGSLRQLAQRTRDDQQKEAQMVEAMLRGEKMSHAMPASTAPASAVEPKTAAAPASKPAPASKAAPDSTKAAPRAAPIAEPKAAPKPATPTCAPEHRAAGHC